MCFWSLEKIHPVLGETTPCFSCMFLPSYSRWDLQLVGHPKQGVVSPVLGVCFSLS